MFASIGIALLVVIATLNPPAKDVQDLFMYMFGTSLFTIGLAYFLYRGRILQWFNSLRWALLATIVLLFGNAFGAYATAYALTGGTMNLVPILIGIQVRGDVLHNPGLGYALALGMVVIMALSIALYTFLQRRTSRWLRPGG